GLHGIAPEAEIWWRRRPGYVPQHPPQLEAEEAEIWPRSRVCVGVSHMPKPPPQLGLIRGCRVAGPMSAARFWWTYRCLFTVSSSRLTDLPMDRGALMVRVSCRTTAGCSVTGWSPAAHCEAGDGPGDFTHLRAGHVSPAQGSPRLQGDSDSLNQWMYNMRRQNRTPTRLNTKCHHLCTDSSLKLPISTMLLLRTDQPGTRRSKHQQDGAEGTPPTSLIFTLQKPMGDVTDPPSIYRFTSRSPATLYPCFGARSAENLSCDARAAKQRRRRGGEAGDARKTENGISFNRPEIHNLPGGNSNFVGVEEKDPRADASENLWKFAWKGNAACEGTRETGSVLKDVEETGRLEADVAMAERVQPNCSHQSGMTSEALQEGNLETMRANAGGFTIANGGWILQDG
ncbi:unnamed protein product, partial [Pleuronectes platessa]